MARLFVAVRPPDGVLDLLEALPRPAEPGVRYTPRAQWHVTLRFLGDADPAEVGHALAPLTSPAVTARLGPRVARLGRDVVVVPVEGLAGLAADVAELTGGLGEPPDPRPFAGHLTVARLRRRGACGIAGAVFDAAFEVGQVVLFSSTPGPSGALHERCSTVALGGGGS